MGNIRTSTGFGIGAATPVDDRYVFETLAQRDAYNPHLLYQGLLCYVIETELHYVYKGAGLWQEAIGNTSIHLGGDEPTNKNLIWVNNKEEFALHSSDAVMDEFRKSLADLTQKYLAIQSRFDHVIDPGYFPERNSEESDTLAVNYSAIPQKSASTFSLEDLPELPPGSNLIPPTSEPIPDAPLPPNSNLPLDAEPQPNANMILLKRGYKADLPMLSDGELGYCRDTKELYVGTNGKLVLLNGAGNGAGSNITAQYIDLESPSKQLFRLSITDQGTLQILDMSEAEKPDPKPEEAGLFKGLIVNSMYGGGFEGANNTAVSHGYIELYNTTLTTFSLKGLSVHYGQFGQAWRTLNLVGNIPPQTSFLIRCAKHSDESHEDLKYNIEACDMEWNIPLTDMGMKVYLSVGRAAPQSENPWASTGDTSSPVAEAGYIDMLAAGGEDITNTINGCEASYGFLMNRNTCVRRNDFKDSNNNLKDSKAFNYALATPEEIATYRPRSLKDGRWDVYFDKTPMDKTKPSMMVLGFGQDAETTRTFSWQTVRTPNQQFVWYRKVGQPLWTQINTDRRGVQYPDVDTYIFNAIIRNLEAGTYEYRVGEPFKEDGTSITSDIYTFEVQTHEALQSFKILQITDQQGWNQHEYETWNKAAQFILENETFDFVLNTGDFSQNGDRRFEWTDYFVGSHDMHRKWPLMGTIGNNDMVRKIESWAYTYYFNTENNASIDGKEIVSCYEWELGDCWFCCLNSNEDVELQKAWFIEKVSATTKRWKIVYTHDAPYTITKLTYSGEVVNGVYRNDSKLFYHFARLFESYGVHLVLCGHKHNYCRSLPVYNTYAVNDATTNANRIKNEPERGTGNSWTVPVWLHADSPNPNDPERPYVDYDKGVMYCMSNATGFKLKSNKDIPTNDWFYGHVQEDKLEKYPQYTMWTITPESIHVDSYQIYNLKFPDPTDNNGVIYKHKFDSYTLDYKEKPYREMAYVGQIKPNTEHIEISASETDAIFKVRLTIAPTHNQTVRFNLSNDKVTLTSAPLSEAESAAGVTVLIDNVLTFTPLNYHMERTIRITKQSGATTGDVILTLHTPQDPEINATISDKVITLTLL